MKIQLSVGIFLLAVSRAAAQLVGIGYDAESGHSEFRAVNPSNGSTTLLNRFDFPRSGGFNPDCFAADGGAGVAYAASGRLLYKFDTATGAVLGTPTLDADFVFLGSAGHRLLGVSFDAASGLYEFRAVHPGNGSSTLLNRFAVPDGRLAAGTFRVDAARGMASVQAGQRFYKFDTDSGALLDAASPDDGDGNADALPSDTDVPLQVMRIAADAPDLTIRTRRVAAGAVTNSVYNDTNVDMPLTLSGNANALGASQIITGGLVADDVTPLLFSLTPAAAPAQATKYNVTFGPVTGGTLSTAALTQHLRVLSGGVFVQSSQITISSASPTYAYLNAFRAEGFTLAKGSTQINVPMTVQRADGLGTKATITFAIRRPPIVLVHGFNTPGGEASWDPAFLGVLDAERGADFVQTIRYAPLILNTTETLRTLAVDLDGTLAAGGGVEDTAAGPFAQWALTRYDLLCHSQGGVLARMLCTQTKANPQAATTPFGTEAFRTAANFYRGRFRRVVTIGSPHNGSRILHYLVASVNTAPDLWYTATLPFAIRALIQPKFDPFDAQIQQINNPVLQVDPTAKFHLTTTTIAGGSVPTPSATNLAYHLLDFDTPAPGQSATRGAIVLGGVGSDGVVDLTSQQGGDGSVDAPFPGGSQGGDVAHSKPGAFFGVPDTQTDTADPDLAGASLALFDAASGSNFGPFILPTPLVPGGKEQQAINAAVPTTEAYAPITVVGSPTHSEGVTAYNCVFTVDPNAPMQGPVTWYGEVFGAGSVGYSGVGVQVNPSDSTQAVVGVSDAVKGDVVVHASYNSSTGKIVQAKARILVSRPAGGAGATVAGLALTPTPLTIDTGERVALLVSRIYSDATAQPLFISPETTIKFMSSNTSALTVTHDGFVKGVAPGTSTVTVSYGGLTAQATVTVVTLVVTPIITSATTATAVLGKAFSYKITASNGPTSYGATGVPAGLTVDSSTGLISGTPTAAGKFTLGLRAANGAGVGTQTLTLTVTQAVPVITSAKTASVAFGKPFSYQITATNNPTSYGVLDLPAGLTADNKTGLISGTPTNAGKYTLTLVAYNGGGKGQATLTLTVTQAIPVITSEKTATGKVGQAFSYQITATNNPTSYGVLGVPAGLVATGNTGLISGKPTAAGKYTLTLKAINGGGSGQATLTLTVTN